MEFGCFKGGLKTVQVLFNGIKAVMVVAWIILNWPASGSQVPRKPVAYNCSRLSKVGILSWDDMFLFLLL